MKSPTVSVIMATYNHADYVAQAIDSVLSQRGVDFEFLIADDGSSDNTRDVVASIRDKRIHFFPNKENRGACAVANELITRASGKFIALINSDDYWIGDDKLTYQLQVLQENPTVGACFGRVRFIDKAGIPVSKTIFPFGSVFDQENKSQGKWLRHFFDCGNCICHPTMLIRKECYDTLGMYDNRLRQLPDFDMWVRLLKKYSIYVSDREMIAFRYLPGENASSSTTGNMRRLLSESYFILRRFFDAISLDIFLEGFADLLVKSEYPDEIHIDIEQSLLYLAKNRWASHIYNLIGIEKIYALMDSDKHRQILNEHYGINDRAFHLLLEGVYAFDSIDPSGHLFMVNGKSLIAEVNRRVLLRTPSFLRPIVNGVLKRF